MATLDTTILVDLLRRRSKHHQTAVAKLADLASRGDSLLTTRFNVAELEVGIELSDDPPRDRRNVDLLLAEIGILEFEALAAGIFAKITVEKRREGTSIGDMDALIAATSLAAGQALLVTRNPSHFANIPGLDVEDY
jgi:predicted nucleic acid-binding protein